jgi:DNA-binding response OmpR family regulator
MMARVLVIDDTAETLAFACGALERAGYEVLFDDSVLGAVRAIVTHRPDVVLLDVFIAGMSDARLTSIARACTALSSAIVLYARKTSAALDAAVQRCGARAWVRKSADEQHLLATIGSVLRNGSARSRSAGSR